MSAVSRKAVVAVGRWPRLTWAFARSNARKRCFLWAEISAAPGTICRCSRAPLRAAKPDFIEVFGLAQRLLTDSEHWPRQAALVGVVQCCSLLAQYRPRSTRSSR